MALLPLWLAGGVFAIIWPATSRRREDWQKKRERSGWSCRLARSVLECGAKRRSGFLSQCTAADMPFSWDYAIQKESQSGVSRRTPGQ
jgi:hypothetical protein